MRAALELAVGLAHDVRSPLGAIMSLAEVLESGAGGPVTERQRRLLSVVREAAWSLSQITTDIVNSAHATHGVERPTTFEVQDVLGAVRAIVQPMAEHAGLNLVVTSSAPSTWVGAPTAITRVLLNLATNAIKYTERGTVEYGALQVSPTRIQFFVRDSGGGMGCGAATSVAAQQPQWRQAKSGLGLAISKKLVDAMGSSLTLESRPGEGCCFRFELNRKRRVSGVESRRNDAPSAELSLSVREPAVAGSATDAG